MHRLILFLFILLIPLTVYGANVLMTQQTAGSHSYSRGAGVWTGYQGFKVENGDNFSLLTLYFLGADSGRNRSWQIEVYNEAKDTLICSNSGSSFFGVPTTKSFPVGDCCLENGVIYHWRFRIVNYSYVLHVKSLDPYPYGGNITSSYDARMILYYNDELECSSGDEIVSTNVISNSDNFTNLVISICVISVISLCLFLL